MEDQPLVLPTRVRRRTLKHAFEEALDAVQLEPDADLPPLSEENDFLSASRSGPAVGSFGDIGVASGYVTTASLARAYGAEADRQNAAPELPAEAAAKLKAVLAAAAHTPDDLRRLRRRFAASNHPDRVPPELRAEAVAAMAEVNAEIDRALKRAETA
jgi:hypothetical protein